EEDWRGQDPIVRLRDVVLEQGELNEEDFVSLQDAATNEIESAIAWAQTLPEPELEKARSFVTLPFLDATSPEPDAGTRKLSYTAAITEAMHLEMQADENVIILGEDIAKTGGIFGLTRGLLEAFGPERIRDTPIAESVTASCGVGAAMSGLRPIIEVQLFDFVTFMMDAIVNQAAKARYMMGGDLKVPVVFRGPQGGGLRLAAQHCQSLEALFANVPGLEIYAPASPYDAKGLMAAAIRSDNPVVFLEHKLLYLGGEEPVPELPYVIQPGEARVVREGADCTVIATMAMVERAMQAAKRLDRKGISVEVIDPRTIKPLDTETMIKSVQKTHRAVVVQEAPLFGGIAGEVASVITEEAFDWLDAPVKRIGAPEMPVPYNERLERQYLPDAERIEQAVLSVCYR
ncbi:MAG: pyruvate dehydrogenase complex E1 component subunit beta, partial [Pseudomonadota bacterium]